MKPPKFFMPGKSAEEAEELLKGFRDDVAWATSEKRIYGITFRDGKKEVRARVGNLDPLEGRMVMAILEAGGFFLI